MNKNVLGKSGAVLLGAIAGAVALLALLLCLRAPGARPILLAAKNAPDETVSVFLDALCGGDYDQASSCVIGGLPVEETPQDEDAAKLWELLRESWRWESAGEVITSGATARQAIRITYLDLLSLTADLSTDVNTLLGTYVEEAKLASDVYNEDNSYREEVVLRAWNQAYSARLARSAEFITSAVIDLELEYTPDGWKVLANDALLRALSGGV